MTGQRWALGLALLLVPSTFLVSATGATEAPSPAPADERVVWLCRPGMAHNPCEIPTDTTAQRMGKDRVYTLPRQPSDKRRVDCFYVYPTVSNQLGFTASKAKDPEIISIAKYQASRFSTRCRIFAPVYRQVTLAGIAAVALGGEKAAYRDVLQAWRSYLKHDNKGRGVVLIGHSQGTILLRHLITEEIDRNPAVRDRLVGALLLGGNVTVKDGRDRGGDFRNVRVCTRHGQVGCVVAYSTYSTNPGPVSFFGNSAFDVLSAPFNSPSGRGYEVACTDPTRLSGRKAPLSVTVPSEEFAQGPINIGIAVTTLFDVPRAATTWVTPPDRWRGRCRTIQNAHVLRYDPLGDSRRPAEFPPTWGTHLVDMNLGLDHLLAIVRQQSSGWLARH